MKRLAVKPTGALLLWSSMGMSSRHLGHPLPPRTNLGRCVGTSSSDTDLTSCLISARVEAGLNNGSGRAVLGRIPAGRERNMPEVVVYALGGRSLDQKRALMKDITDAVVKNYKVEPGAVVITLVESEKQDKMKGGVLFSEQAR